MDFEWVAIALGDVLWISLAFVLGLFARLFGLPPLVGFLATGFILNQLGASSGEVLQKLADLGITLLLFSVGLKLRPKVLLKPQVWAVTVLHMGLVVALLAPGFLLLAWAGWLGDGLSLQAGLLLAFALSFSSTVFVVKTLEEKGEMKSLHGRIAIGILIMQDLLAVVFLAASTGKLPSPWALLLFLLIPLRPLFNLVLQRAGHGELLILYGLVLALGGAELFELAGVKDDLGALVMGLLVSRHPKATEMARSLFAFKDLFLVGFFLSIGLAGQLSLDALLLSLLLVPFLFVKSALYFGLMTRFRLRARTALLASLNLINYSEFGLIVVAMGVSAGWIDGEWLVVVALALSLSFALAAPLNRYDDQIYRRYRNLWLRFQRPERLPEDRLLDISGYSIAIFGIGRVGTGAYDRLRERHGDTVVGVDFDAERVRRHQQAGRRVIRGDPSDADFWDQIGHDHGLEFVLLALPNLEANLDALAELRQIEFSGRIAATARYPDEEARLRAAGAGAVFNIYAEAGAGFADHAEANSAPKPSPLVS